VVASLGLEDTLGMGIRIQFDEDLHAYFANFNEILKTTDVLWTKPSELVFYAGLGLPLILSKPLGAHEESNLDWIRRMGAGYPMEDPRYTHEWLRDWIQNGMLAEAAFDAYAKAPRHGTENIRRLVFSKEPLAEELRVV
jgi:UDP-N-acetylglucosamine:LPS N-acetylglucosamine transferase